MLKRQRSAQTLGPLLAISTLFGSANPRVADGWWCLHLNQDSTFIDLWEADSADCTGSPSRLYFVAGLLRLMNVTPCGSCVLICEATLSQLGWKVLISPGGMPDSKKAESSWKDHFLVTDSIHCALWSKILRIPITRTIYQPTMTLLGSVNNLTKELLLTQCIWPYQLIYCMITLQAFVCKC